MPVNAWRVCWNWSLTASLEGKRSNEHSNKDLMKKYYARLSISIESNQARKVNYPNVMPVRTSKVHWSWSSTASLEVNDFKFDKKVHRIVSLRHPIAREGSICPSSFVPIPVSLSVCPPVHQYVRSSLN